MKEDMVLGLFLVLSVSPLVRGSEWRKMMIDDDDDDDDQCRASCPLMSVDILGTNCDQCGSTVRYCFTST